MMKRREQYLIGGLLAAFVVWQSSGLISSVLFEPFQTASTKLDELKKTVSGKRDNLLALARAGKLLKEWKAISLPPDPGKPKQPTALNAQRLYLQWLTDLAELNGFEELRVQAGSTSAKGKVSISVVVKIEAEARFEQLTQFLDLFYRTDLLHRVSSLRVSTKVSEGDPQLKISLEAEGIALIDAPSRRTLFPETNLKSPLPEDGTTVDVASSKEFPKAAGFRVKIRNEILKVTTIDGDRWTLERGSERTNPSSHLEGSPVELVRLHSNSSEPTLAEFREMISNNIFVKPSPKYRMKLGPLGEKAFTRGKSIDFTIAAMGFDPLLGKPEFQTTGEVPVGLRLDKSGKLSWKPGSEIAAGKYPVTFEVRHPSAPDGCLTETVTISLRDSKAKPKLVETKPPQAYLNREWIYRPELVSNSATSKFTWKIGEPCPKGMVIDDQSGEIKWTPGDEVAIGETTITLVVNDAESPPQSTSLSLKINVEDDAAQFTRLTGIVEIDTKKRVFLTDQSTDKKTELQEGDRFAISEIRGTIKSVTRKYLIVSVGEQEIRWDIGQSLREAQNKGADY